jgi:uncharacterized protein YndB with AHSA1/START domain
MWTALANPSARRLEIGGDLTVRRLGFGAMRVTGPRGVGRAARPRRQGNDLPWASRFEEIHEPERLVFAVIDAPELGDEYELMTMTLTESGGTTELVLRQSGGHLTDEQYQEAKEGTAGFLDALAEVVADL